MATKEFGAESIEAAFATYLSSEPAELYRSAVSAEFDPKANELLCAKEFALYPIRRFLSRVSVRYAFHPDYVINSDNVRFTSLEVRDPLKLSKLESELSSNYVKRGPFTWTSKSIRKGDPATYASIQVELNPTQNYVERIHVCGNT